MPTMKAVRIHSFGGPEVLALEELEVPQPRDDEVLIRVHAASVNPVDYKIRAGGFPAVKQDSLPRILGRDLSGTIERCGRAVTGWKAGDEVYAMLDGGGKGSYAQYVSLAATLCAPKPKQLNHVEAAALPLAAITAWQGEIDHGKLAEGQRELIHGGAGGVGHLAVQIAKARGARVATTVSRKDVEFARSWGADDVIDYQSQRFEDEVDDIDLVFDLVGGATQQRSWAELGEIGKLVDAGRVRPHVQAVFPLEEAAEAQRTLENGHVRGKVVLQMIA